MSTYSDPSEHSDDSPYFDKPQTTIEERDSSSDEREAVSHRTPPRPVTQGPKPFAEAVYGVRGRVTARKSVPIPIRRTFRIPNRDEAGPSRVRGRSVSTSPPPPPEVRAPEARPLGMTPHERFMFSGMTDDIRMHQMKLGSLDYAIGVILNVLTTTDDILGDTLESLARARASIHQLYTLVYLLVAMMIVMLGWMILWFGH